MGSFKSTIITSRGHNLMAKLSAGTATMSFTKIKSSSHDYSALTSSELEALTSIEDIKQEVNVSEVTRINDASVKVSGTLVNTALTTGYYMKAIALYATDPDLGEILYSITASIESDWMPPYNSISSASALIDLITVVSNAENVSIDVDPNAIVSITQFNEFKESVSSQLSDIVSEQTTQNNNITNKVDKVSGKGLSTNDYDNTEKSQVATNKSDITTIKSQVASLASGSPKAVSLVANMTDTAKNYVYTGSESGYVAGNWYYYNGSAWTSGGVYQSSGIAPNSVTLEERTANGHFGFLISNNLININTTSKQLEFPPNSTVHFVYGNKFVDLTSKYAGTTLSMSAINNGGFIYFDTVDSTIYCVDSVTNIPEFGVVIGYLYFTTNIYNINMNFTIDSKENWRANSVITSNIKDNSVTTLKRTVLGDFGCIISQAPLNINTNALQIEFPNEAGLSIFYRGVKISIATTYKNSTLNISALIYGGFIFYDTVANSFVVSTSNSANENCISLGYLFPSTKTGVFNANYVFDKKDYARGKWFGKIINCLGDSTTWGDNGQSSGSNSISWVAHMSDLCGFSTVRNYGICGSKIAVTERTDSFVARYSTMNADADVILVLGGVNDFLFGTPLGIMGSTDNTTFYGALNLLANGLLTMYPNKKVIFGTPMKCDHASYGGSFRTNSLGLKQTDYVEAIKKVCDYYSIPILDMYANSGISPFNSTQSTQYMPDKLHYSEDGYTRLASTISAFLKSI